MDISSECVKRAWVSHGGLATVPSCVVSGNEVTPGALWVPLSDPGEALWDLCPLCAFVV